MANYGDNVYGFEKCRVCGGLCSSETKAGEGVCKRCMKKVMEGMSYGKD
jgi:hypothetical protein